MTETTPFPIIPENRGDDLHGLEHGARSQLNLFMAGNQFMVMDELLAAFRARHPDIRRIYCQTLPPGLQLKQILAGGARFSGRIIDAAADIYTAVSRQAMRQLVEAGRIASDGYHRYLHNRLVLLVPAANSAAIRTVADLAGDSVRISQPDPAGEDIAHHIIAMYHEAGGEALVKRIMEEKRTEGTTVMTVVHHRETPQRLCEGTVDVGPVWATEAIHADRRRLPLAAIEPGAELDQRRRINYYICQPTASPHPQNAARFMAFMATATARAIYARHGFVTVV